MANQHVYTIETLERLLSEGGRDNTSQNHNGHDTSHVPPLAPAHIRSRIYRVVLDATEAVSRAQIAKALKIKKTPWLLQAIEGLVSDGYLTRSQSIRPNGVVMYWYKVKP